MNRLRAWPALRLRAGTRGSDLALWQTEAAARALCARRPEAEVEVVTVTTRGDTDLSDHLVGRLDKGFFTAELEAGLREGRLDLAVHSLKDLPTAPPEGLCLGAILPRGPVEDWLLARPEAVLEAGPGLLPLAPGARVGSSALRREALLRRYAPAARALPLRGNVPTRLERLREGRYDAIVLAAAGASRLELNLSGLAVFSLDPLRWIPAPGQGAVAVQCRADDAVLLEALREVNDPATARAVGLERALLAASEGGCASAFGATAAGETLVWGMEVDGAWRRYRAPAGPWVEEQAALLFHHRGILWEDEDDAPLHRPL